MEISLMKIALVKVISQEKETNYLARKKKRGVKSYGSEVKRKKGIEVK
jgi:hypothetical protein